VSNAPSTNGSTTTKTGLKIDRVFSDPDVHPFDQIEWAERTAEIKDETGKAVFKQEGCEFPEAWSQLAVNVVASKYFYGDVTHGNGSPADGKREYSVKQLVGRVAKTIADWGDADGYFDTRSDADAFEDELTWLLVNQHGAFNSPVWFNCGLWRKYSIEGDTVAWRWDEATQRTVPLAKGEAYKYPQISACFIQSVDDTMDSIMDLAKAEAMLFKAGSGTGTDLSTLRSTKEKLAGGGKPSGPVSFFRVYDTIASIVKSGGKTRRAARMQTLLCDHPDVLEFISCKSKEDKKARALIDAGYSAGLTGDADEAYSSVAFQNTNISIRGTDEFMRKASGDDPDPNYWTKAVVTGKPVDQLNAKEVLNAIAQSTWECGDPGMQFHTTINEWHTCPNTAPINSSNPCCFVYETCVDTSEGRIPIGKLAEMDAAGQQLPYAFGFDRGDGLPALRRITKAWKAGETKKIARVTTQRGLVFESTPDHRYLMHNGKYVEAFRLKPGQRLRKINRQVNTRRANRKWLLHRITADRPNGCTPQNRWMWEQVHGPLSDEFEVHHVNEDPTDDRMSNFQVIKFRDHQSLHSRGSGNGRFIEADPRIMVEVWEAVENHERGTHKSRTGVTVGLWNKYVKANGLQGKIPLARYSDEGGRIQGKTWAEFSEWIDSQRVLVNDRVQSVEIIELESPIAVYDIEVEGIHNFGIGSKDSVHSIVVSNSEYMFLSNSACNLASLNLLKFIDADGNFDVDRFTAAVQIFITAQEILVDRGSYPTEKIARNSHDFRPLGLGYANLGALLMSMGLPYDSDQGRSLAGAITAIMQGVANYQSSQIASFKGPFSGYELNAEPMNKVMDKHCNSASGHRDSFSGGQADQIARLWGIASRLWNRATIDNGKRHGYRNGQVSVIAPTGTIAFMMDCDTTGLEPDLALVKYKKLAGGGTLKITNQSVSSALRKLGYLEDAAQRIVVFINENDTIEGAPGFNREHLPVFDCAFPCGEDGRSIHWKGHVKMMAAIQPFISGALSKSVNLPNNATVEDIRDAYILGWRLGLKAMAVYRDGSKGVQPLNTKSEPKKDEPASAQAAAPRRERLPDTRRSVTHKFDIQGHEGYVTVGFYPDGRPGELFVTMAKEGSTIGGLMDAWATAISIGLQYGVPLDVIVAKFEHSRFEPSGFTQNPDIRMAKSLTDYIARWLGMECLKGYREANAPDRDYESKSDTPVATTTNAPKYQQDSPACSNCGALTVRAGSCYLCTSCGSSSGCG
jgi:ribonucleotide reductase alpha subunit